MTRTVLVSGAGVAGATLAYWLNRHGFAVTVVERSPGQRSSGNPVDVKGPAVRVADDMGVLPRLRSVASDVTRMTFVADDGRPLARLGLAAFGGGAGDREVEVPRAELASILLDTVRDDVEFLWDDTISELRQDSAGVSATFARSAPRRFDLVIGADGLHSTVRRLTFGPATEFVRHLGMYVATMRVEEPMGSDREVIIYNTPGRAVSVHPTRGNAVAAFMFRHAAVPGLGYRDTDRHRSLVAAAFADAGWRVPELLDLMRGDRDLYFDSVSQVRLPRWSDGRIALVGDAASCLSLFGDGSTLAMAGAHTLAAELAAWSAGHHPDPQTAFRRYEDTHRAVVAPKLNGYRLGAAMLLPATRAGIVTRNLAARLSPALTTAASLRRSRVPG